MRDIIFRPTAFALVSLSSVLLASGCNQTSDAAEFDAEDARATMSTTVEEIEGLSEVGDVSAIEAQMWLDDFALGTGVDSQGRVHGDLLIDRFPPGSTIFVSMAVGDAPALGMVRVDWIYEDELNERTVSSEEKQISVGDAFLSFSETSEGWLPGRYRASVWIADEKVTDQNFEIIGEEL